mmetsp:Transcript_36233/g.69475  ORF Transcript_36233/g.69475 Transcript_36233/m.69475 type:complete len:429 (-) Transcript_36233:349-1635(-)
MLVILELGYGHRHHPYRRDWNVKNLWWLFPNHVVIIIPGTSVKVHSCTVHSVLWTRLAVAWLVHHLEVEVHFVDFNLELAGVVLLGCSEEGLCEKEAGEPEHHGGTLVDPFLEKVHPLAQLLDVASQGLERRERLLQPHRGHLAYKQRLSHHVQGVREQDESLDGLLDVGQTVADNGDEVVDARALLHQDGVHAVVVVLRVGPLHRLAVKVGLDARGDVHRHLANHLLLALAGAAPSRVARLGGHQRIQKQVRVLHVLGDIRVFVQAVHLRGRDERQGADVVYVPLPLLRVRRRVVLPAGGELVLLGENLGVVEEIDDGHQRAAVGAVRHLASVVALPGGVLESLVGHLVVLVQKHLKLAQADAQVVVVELVRDVEPNGPVPRSVLEERVEEGQPKEHLAPRGLLVAREEEGVVRGGVVVVGPDEPRA